MYAYLATSQLSLFAMKMRVFCPSPGRGGCGRGRFGRRRGGVEDAFKLAVVGWGLVEGAEGAVGGEEAVEEGDGDFEAAEDGGEDHCCVLFRVGEGVGMRGGCGGEVAVESLRRRV